MISIIHPSIGRPKMGFKTYLNWNKKASTQIEYISVLDGFDFRYYHPYGDITVIMDYGRLVQAVNEGAKKATGNLLIVISDDFDCFDGWDVALLNEVKGKSDFVLKTVDNINPQLVTLPILDRVYYERYGYIYHPDYSHMFADNHLTEVAKMNGKLLYSNLVFNHDHPVRNFDDTYKRGMQTFNEGRAIFEKHKANAFAE